MYVDAQLLLMGTLGADNTITAQEAKGTDTSVLSGNTADLVKNTDLGEGENLYAVVTVDTAAVGGTSVEFQAIQADDAALSSNVVVVGSSGAKPIAGLTKGARFAFRLNPQIGSKGKRYLGLRAVTAGAVTAGKYVGFVTLDIQDGQTTYPSGSTII